MALMLITHDMGVIAQMADDVAVMYLGRIVEFAPVAQLFAAPQHPYTRALLRSVPNLQAVPRERLATIGGAVPHPGAPPGRLPVPSALPGDHRGTLRDRGAAGHAARRARRELLPRAMRRPSHAAASARAHRPCSRSTASPRNSRSAAGCCSARPAGCARSQDVSFSIGRGETLALVGESGCGKTTVVALHPARAAADRGRDPLFARARQRRIDLAPLSRRALRPLRRHIQMIFQDPYASLNPRMMVGDIIAEPLLVNGMPAAQRQARVRELLDLVGLPAAARTRFPHAFSGGQRQRIGIARALALDPSLVVADEPVSALDVSVQAQIINLLLDLQDRLGLSMLFVAHDLGVVRHVSDRVAVMYVGRIVETAPTTALYATPRHPYTEALLAAVPKADPALRDQVSRARAARSPIRPTRRRGCAFHPRCPYAVDRCRTELPALARNRTRALERLPSRRRSCRSAALPRTMRRKRHALISDRPDRVVLAARPPRSSRICRNPAWSESWRTRPSSPTPRNGRRSSARRRRWPNWSRPASCRRSTSACRRSRWCSSRCAASANTAAPGGAAFSAPATARTAIASARATSCCSGT